jgi:ubiquinone/menaquinone biosynthesis C-methylase UbiE
MVQAVVNWLEKQRRMAVLSHVRGRYLDIGCGLNKAVRDYRAKGGDGIGIDVYDFGGADRIVKNTATLDYADGSFETISFIACLNHIPNRQAVLREAHRLLSSNGCVLLTMIPPRLSAVWHRVIRPWDEDQTDRGMIDGEVWGLTASEMVELLRKAGFRHIARHRFVFGLNNLYIASK